MDPVAVVLILVALIVVVTALLAISAGRQSPGSRGSAPGKGFHELRSDYQSGMGGGHSQSWKIPRDPQDYAKLFIPKDAKK
ncbi:hypothetical protein [Tropicibacter oceani]|uniref:Secreted protein n=1 Tax=Tropicibacter oceani TaxID=3058420 RepID=A0ABY8QDN1_9RHOB|nr:hypothetical protein [Tropicibacter oceani]WGW02685.1 hypothetical protein QF118_12130 [Tropicibacter oceani]